MKVIERPLNVYEQFLGHIEEAKTKGTRVAEVVMTPAEYEEFYRVGMAELCVQAAHELMTKKTCFGITIKISDEESKKNSSKKRNQ